MDAETPVEAQAAVARLTKNGVEDLATKADPNAQYGGLINITR